tara:strand:+ start:276 stop:743 length:468 start_codon:yes stop_codon:yes gene_type:complete
MTIEARELQLYIENDSRLYHQFESIRLNLVRKIAKGVYQHDRAAKHFQYLSDAGSKLYEQEFGHAFDVATRKETAQSLADDFAAEVACNEHDHRLSGIHKKRAEAGGGLAKMIQPPQANNGTRHDEPTADQLIAEKRQDDAYRLFSDLNKFTEET